jgi:hypothetical protein
MFRPMTSSVSALSGIVANGHQTVHPGSSAPSKTPYGGCSPVRLQAGCQPRPSPPTGGFDATTVEISAARVLVRSGTGCPVQAARVASDTTHLPSGPWLRQWLCCPPASSLTMATSELLRRSTGFIPYCRRTWCVAEGPHFQLPELADVPSSLPRWFQGTLTNPSLGFAFAKAEEARQPHDPHTGLRVADLTRLQRSLHAAARQLASPAPDRTFTTELACAGSLQTQVGHDYRNVRLIPDGTFTRCSRSFVGCTPPKSTLIRP